MRTGTRAVAVCAVVCLHAGVAAAQSRVMTLAEVLARAREQAPQIVSARLALEESRGRLAGASVRFQSNPQIDAAIGNRNGPDTRFTDLELGLGQSFEPGARRSARTCEVGVHTAHCPRMPLPMARTGTSRSRSAQTNLSRVRRNAAGARMRTMSEASTAPSTTAAVS